MTYIQVFSEGERGKHVFGRVVSGLMTTPVCVWSINMWDRGEPWGETTLKHSTSDNEEKGKLLLHPLYGKDKTLYYNRYCRINLKAYRIICTRIIRQVRTGNFWLRTLGTRCARVQHRRGRFFNEIGFGSVCAWTRK